jgi:uncharacterized repeat protein (TIGR01451 family)
MRKSLKFFSSLALFTATTAVAGLLMSAVAPSYNQKLQVSQSYGNNQNGYNNGGNHAAYYPQQQQQQQPQGSCSTGACYAPEAPVCAPAPVCPPPAAECGNTVTINTELVRITKTYPAKVDLNQEFVVEMTATALDNASNVVVTETIPAGVNFVRSEPNSAAAADRQSWTFKAIKKGESQTVKLWLKPTACGEICGCTTVTAVPFICAPVFVGCPCIVCKKTGPARVNCNEPVEFQIVVTNTGTAVAKNVLVTENLPAEVEHASGQRVLKFPLGDLQPGETKQICVRVKALTRCVRVCNTITTTSSNCQGSGCECCLDICQSIVSIRKSGPGEQYICKNADYQLVIKNEGDNVLNNVIVTDNAPQGTTVVMAPGANISGNNASWIVKSLNPGEEKVFNIKLTAAVCGNYCNRASVRASDGCGADTELCTLWKGCSGITMCVTDCEDPICVGNCDTYKITVRNQGVVADKNVGITATLSAELQPINGAGPTGCTVSGQTVTFKPIASLAPKQAAEYTIRAKAVAPGDARVKVSLTSDFLSKPVVDEESTQVY